MAIIKCKMCGGDIELSQDKTFGTCEFCGNPMTFPKVDDEQRATAFNRGNHFRRIGEFDKALAVYERIVRENDGDAEAHWCCALCRFGIEYVEDPATFEWLPTCHRASFDSFLEDVDYLAALEYSDGITRRQYQKDAAKIAEVQRGILATSQNSEPYDVFICYKESDENGNRTRDSLLAQDIYYQLTDQGRKVFFSRVTLEDMVGTQYEPYIFAALNSAKVMIVVGTKGEYMNAVWVKNEWSRFLAMMKKDRNKVLLPCYRDMDPYDMPEQLSVLQSYDMSKIGFIQDLIRGIAKVLDADRKPEPVKETVVVQQAANSNLIALLKRGNMALEDGEWDRADGFFEEVLNQDAECAEAYLGKLMAEHVAHSQEELAECKQCIVKSVSYQRALRFATAERAKALKALGEKNKASLLRRGNDALLTGQWDEADAYFEEALKHDDACAEAYLGRFLAERQCRNLADIVEAVYNEMLENEQIQQIEVLIDSEQPEQWVQSAIEKYMLPGVFEESEIRSFCPTNSAYESTCEYWNQQVPVAKACWHNMEMLQLAYKYADPAMRMEIENQQAELTNRVEQKIKQAQEADARTEETVKLGTMEAFETANVRLQEKYTEATKTLEARYAKACELIEYSNDYWRMKSLANDFFAMGNYKDARQKYLRCQERVAQIDQENERRKKSTQWQFAGRCAHCGGQFQGVFAKKCAKCGKPKDY